MLYNRNYNFNSGETIIADQIDDEFNGIRTVLNGNIEADNIKDNSITTDKLDATLDPTTRTAETIGDIVVSGLELQSIRSLTGTWTNRDESISDGIFYIDGVRVSATFGGGAEAHTYTASTTTYVLIDENGVLHYETSTSVGYNNVALYKVTCDGTKITMAQPLAWGLTGSVLPYAGKDAPSGYLLCQGGEFSRTTYSKLFNVIQNMFGTPSGSSVFKVPDLRTRTVHGYGDPSYYTVFGGAGGGYTASHSHGLGGHYHYVGGNTSYTQVATGGADRSYTLGSAGSPAQYHSFSVNSGGPSGGSDAAAPSILDPYITLNYIIKAS